MRCRWPPCATSKTRIPITLLSRLRLWVMPVFLWTKGRPLTTKTSMTTRGPKMDTTIRRTRKLSYQRDLPRSQWQTMLVLLNSSKILTKMVPKRTLWGTLESSGTLGTRSFRSMNRTELSTTTRSEELVSINSCPLATIRESYKTSGRDAITTQTPTKRWLGGQVLQTQQMDQALLSTMCKSRTEVQWSKMVSTSASSSPSTQLATEEL